MTGANWYKTSTDRNQGYLLDFRDGCQHALGAQSVQGAHIHEDRNQGVDSG